MLNKTEMQQKSYCTRRPLPGELNPIEAEAVLNCISEMALDARLTVFLDFDDTIVVDDERMCPHVNRYLVEFIALLFIKKRNSIDFSIISMRQPDEAILAINPLATNTIATMLPIFFEQVIGRLMHYKQDDIVTVLREIQKGNPCVIDKSQWYCLKSTKLTKAEKVHSLLENEEIRSSVIVYVDDNLTERRIVQEVFNAFAVKTFVIQVYRFEFECDTAVSFPQHLENTALVQNVTQSRQAFFPKIQVAHSEAIVKSDSLGFDSDDLR